MHDNLTPEAVAALVARIDAHLAAEPAAYGLGFDRGQLLELLGRTDDALRSYLGVLERDPAHVASLNAVGLIFLGAGNREAARMMLRAAVLHGPEHAAAHANAAYLALSEDRLDEARPLYERALALDPTLALAHHGFAQLLDRQGDGEGAARHRLLGMRHRPITISRYRGTGAPVRVLSLGTARVGNVATYFDDRTFLVASLVVEFADPRVPLPPHDVVFTAVGEADACAAELATAERIVARTTAPIVNAPRIVARTTRAENARRLRALPGVIAPRIAPFPRAVLERPSAAQTLAEHGFTFPLLVRSPGFHTGEHFSRVEAAAELPAAVAALPGDELLAIEYLDVRDASGAFRKYRVIIVGERLYPLHLAIAHSWKVHYFSAEMDARADYRAYDAAFLADPAGTVGAPAYAALERVRVMLGLDYGGIDFAVASSGEAVVFEANASMIVPMPGADPKWEYRREPVARIHAAVRELFVRRAARGVSVSVVRAARATAAGDHGSGASSRRCHAAARSV